MTEWREWADARLASERNAVIHVLPCPEQLVVSFSDTGDGHASIPEAKLPTCGVTDIVRIGRLVWSVEEISAGHIRLLLLAPTL